MRKTYNVKIDCLYFGIEYRSGDRISLSDYEKSVFETQNINCLGDVVGQQVQTGTATVETSPLDAAAINSNKVRKVTKKNKKDAEK